MFIPITPVVQYGECRARTGACENRTARCVAGLGCGRDGPVEEAVAAQYVQQGCLPAGLHDHLVDAGETPAVTSPAPTGGLLRFPVSGRGRLAGRWSRWPRSRRR